MFSVRQKELIVNYHIMSYTNLYSFAFKYENYRIQLLFCQLLKMDTLLTIIAFRLSLYIGNVYNLYSISVRYSNQTTSFLGYTSKVMLKGN
jgi:hypothetical protein